MQVGRNGRAGMSANRGKFVSNIAALRPTDALATPGRSVDGFEGVFVSWALSALRGLFPSRGRAFLRARRAERRKRECLQAEESLSAVSRLCDRRMLPQRPAGLSMVLRAFLRRGLCPRSGGCSLRGGGPFCVAAREAWRSVGKAGRTAGDRPVCVAARGNCDNFRINRLYFTFSANIYMCFTVLCHERQSLRIYCFMSIGDNDTDIWRERS